MSAPFPHPRYRASVDRRRFDGCFMWLPTIDGEPAEGGDSEDHCFVLMCDAMEVATRIAAKRAMEVA